MKKITSAYANKWLKSLEEDKEYWINKEEASSTYVAAINEEPVIPEYDYAEVAATIAEIDEKIAVIKHALNVTNATAKVQVKDTGMSVDTILIKMAQLNKRKAVLDRMRKQLPKTRETTSYMSRNAVPEYRYVNYDLDLVKQKLALNFDYWNEVRKKYSSNMEKIYLYGALYDALSNGGGKQIKEIVDKLKDFID